MGFAALVTVFATSSLAYAQPNDGGSGHSGGSAVGGNSSGSGSTGGSGGGSNLGEGIGFSAGMRIGVAVGVPGGVVGALAAGALGGVIGYNAPAIGSFLSGMRGPPAPPLSADQQARNFMNGSGNGLGGGGISANEGANGASGPSPDGGETSMVTSDTFSRFVLSKQYSNLFALSGLSGVLLGLTNTPYFWYPTAGMPLAFACVKAVVQWRAPHGQVEH